jgi:uncharacterized protein YndB with AHSA1/START domain
MRRHLLVAAAAALVAGPASAAAVPGRPNVVDTSSVAPSGERILQESILLAAPPAEVWRLWATSEGLKSWEAPHAAIDLRIGGRMQASYDPKATLGDATTIEHEIVAYVPGSLLVFRNTKAPKGFPWPDQFARVRNVVQLEPAGEGRTRLTVSGVGYAAGDQALYDFFREGNAYMLEVIKARIEGTPPPAEPAH